MSDLVKGFGGEADNGLALASKASKACLASAPWNAGPGERLRKHPARRSRQMLLSSSEKLAWESTKPGKDHFNTVRQL